MKIKQIFNRFDDSTFSLKRLLGRLFFIKKNLLDLTGKEEKQEKRTRVAGALICNDRNQMA